MVWLLASQRSEVHFTLAALIIGLVIGVFGHLSRTRWMIVLGIAIIAAVSVLFSFVWRPS